METDADRLRYFDAAHFGITVQVGGANVAAIFESGYAEAAGVEGSRPALTCRSADVSSAVRGTAVVVPSVGSFKVITVRDDGTGIARVDLEEV